MLENSNLIWPQLYPTQVILATLGWAPYFSTITYNAQITWYWHRSPVYMQHCGIFDPVFILYPAGSCLLPNDNIAVIPNPLSSTLLVQRCLTTFSAAHLQQPAFWHTIFTLIDFCFSVYFCRKSFAVQLHFCGSIFSKIAFWIMEEYLLILPELFTNII